jgi:hypothetical protein
LIKLTTRCLQLRSSIHHFRDFSLAAVSANGTALTNKRGGAEAFPTIGIGFRTSYAVSLDMSSLQISGFPWGIWIMYTVMAAFKSISIRNCAGGVSLARSEPTFGVNDATSTSGWNAWAGGIYGGLFHNVVTFTNVHVMGGEIGIRVTGMYATFVGCCTEGTSVSANDTNKVHAPKLRD